MGKSITCTFAVHVNFTDGTKVCATQTCYGAMSFKEVMGIMRSEQAYQDQKQGSYYVTKKSVHSAEVWPQTARGYKAMKGDYAVIDMSGKVTHKSVAMSEAA